jgi:hypothetical protein
LAIAVTRKGQRVISDTAQQIVFGERFPKFVLDPSTQTVVVVDHQTVAGFRFDEPSARLPSRPDR